MEEITKNENVLYKRPLSQDEVHKLTDLFLENQSMVRRVAIMYAPNYSLVDDIVNDVYLAFVQNAYHYDLAKDIKPLLYRIAKNCANRQWIEYNRNQPEQIQLLAERVHDRMEQRETILGISGVKEELEALNVCLGKITDRSRQLVDLFYFKKRKLTQIAEELNLKTNTLYSQIDRIRIVLRTCVENILKTEVPDV